jgi:hypothetical protein
MIRRKCMRKRVLCIIAVIACFVSAQFLFFSVPAVEVKAIGETIEVYFIGGQSNAAGFSTNDTVYLQGQDARYISGFDDVLYYGKISDMPTKPLQSVKAGLGKDNPVGGFIGPELGMAYELSGGATKSAIIKFAAGGTYLAPDTVNSNSTSQGTWTSPSYMEDHAITPGGKIGYLYTRFLNIAQEGLNALKSSGYEPIIKGMIWMQGEAESGTSAYANAYDTYLIPFISDIRESLGVLSGQDLSNMPFIIGKIASTYHTSYKEIVRAKQEIAASSVRYSVCVETADLLLPGTDSSHFSCEDMLTLGKRFGTALIQGFNGKFFVGISGGTGFSLTGGGYYAPGTSVQLQFTGDKEHKVTDVVMDRGGATENITQQLINGAYDLLTGEEDIVFTVTVALRERYKINIGEHEGGNIYRTVTRDLYEGESVTFTFLPDEGYRLKKALINGQEVEVTNDRYTVASAASDLNVSAFFERVGGEDPGDGDSPGGESGCANSSIAMPLLILISAAIWIGRKNSV